MEAKVIREHPYRWDSYFKHWEVMLDLECPLCKKKIKYGMTYDDVGDLMKISFLKMMLCTSCFRFVIVRYEKENGELLVPVKVR